MHRRTILISSAAAAVAALTGLGIAPRLSPARAAEMKIYPDDHIMGIESAPVTIIEYASLTCPHCAKLNIDTLPQVKENWIKPGRARYVYRHFPLDGLALRAAAVTDCFEDERFFAFLDLLFKSQERWARADDPLKAIGQMARLGGMTDETFQKCANDQAEMDRIVARAKDGQETYGIEATPTMIINGRKVQGERSYEDLDKILNAAANS